MLHAVKRMALWLCLALSGAVMYSSKPPSVCYSSICMHHILTQLLDNYPDCMQLISGLPNHEVAWDT